MFMDGYDAATYGDRIAEVYDELYPSGPAVEDAAALLAELADGGRVLELGVGTGRLALPLAARGVDVEGVDASASMVAKLEAKPSGDRIRVRIADFGRDRLGENLALVFVAFNTFFGLAEQSLQVDCFANVASALAPGGRFVMEAFVPDLGRFDRGQRTDTTAIRSAAGDDQLGNSRSRHPASGVDAHDRSSRRHRHVSRGDPLRLARRT